MKEIASRVSDAMDRRIHIGLLSIFDKNYITVTGQNLDKPLKNKYKQYTIRILFYGKASRQGFGFFLQKYRHDGCFYSPLL